MLKRIDIPMITGTKKLFLPKEHEKSALVLYRESDDGLVFAGFYDPNVPDEDYLDGIVAVPLRSTFIEVKKFSEREPFYNVKKSSSDKIFVDEKKIKNVCTWIEIWRTVTKRELGATPPEKCYVNFPWKCEEDKICKSKDLVGGHMRFGKSAELDTGAEVYLFPICRSHNIYTNTKKMLLTSDVEAIVMQYKIDTVSEDMIQIQRTHEQIKKQNGVYNGIDLSEHNGHIDFSKVKSAGIDFVMIREGYGSDGLYENQVDKFYAENYSGAKKAGLMVGAYHYLYAANTEEAITEAKGFLENLKGKQFEMPIVLDIEETVQSELPISTVDSIIKAFMDVCEKAGYFCALYSYESFLTNKISLSLRDKYSIWCANTSGTPKIKYGIHQYSFKGTINGVNGFVDLNCAYIDYPSIIKNGGFNGYPKP